ncbi:hypothetical protein ACN2C6_03755 [Caulobacter sp. ErkDOM-YI]
MNRAAAGRRTRSGHNKTQSVILPDRLAQNLVRVLGDLCGPRSGVS